MKIKKFICLTASLLGLILIYIGTYAYYMSIVSGSVTIKASEYLFNVLYNDESLTTIDLYNTVSKPSLTNVRKIIPGNSGEFDLKVVGTGSDVDIEYTIKFNGINVPANMNFYLDGQKFDIQTNVIREYLDIEKESTKIHKITWEWPYDSGKFNALDYNDAGKKMNIDIDVIAKQSQGIFTYGVKRNITSESTEWERIEDSVGLVANAVLSSNNIDVENDFDNIYPWSEIKSYNYNTDTKKVTAWYGDSNFKFDGSNGEVLTYIPGFYYKREVIDDIEYQYISAYEIDGYTYSEPFSVARYLTSNNNGKLTSRSGILPISDKKIMTLREEVKELGVDFSLLDYHYFILQMLYLVEYADYNSQEILGRGLTYLRNNDDDKALVSESNTNRIIISATLSEYFPVGKFMYIGSNYTWQNDIVNYRKIIKKENVEEGVAIYFDGSPVNITVENVIARYANESGDTDLLGMKSGTITNDGETAMVYRGIENFYGGLWQYIDGINIFDYQIYISYDRNDFKEDEIGSSYKKVSFILPNENGYIKTVGYDSNNPLISLPTSSDGTSKTFTTDYFFQKEGIRIAAVGGTNNNFYNAGVWSINCKIKSTRSEMTGSRFLRY